MNGPKNKKQFRKKLNELQNSKKLKKSVRFASESRRQNKQERLRLEIRRCRSSLIIANKWTNLLTMRNNLKDDIKTLLWT